MEGAMSALSGGKRRRSPVEVISQWGLVWTRNGSALSELTCGAEGEVERIARDIGVPASELRKLARLGPEAANLLPIRMEALGLERKDIAQKEPQTLQDLERVCALCESHKQCARDLANKASDQAWEDYCPNVATLKMLNATNWTSLS
jgi:hypothetical protein